MKKTLYDILRVDNNASSEQIDAAYLAQKRTLQNAVDQESQNDLKLVQHAYLVLSDLRQRDKYDQSLKLQIARNNSLIYYSDEYANRSWPTRFIFLIVIAAAVFFAFQHVSKSNASNLHSPAQHDNKAAAPSAVVPTGYAPPSVAAQAGDLTSPQTNTSNSTDEWAIGNHAQIDDVDAVPILGGVGRKHYKEFLSHAGPRAFVICRDGSFSAIYGANQYVTQQLRDRAGGCEPYTINDVVVWRAR